MSGYLIHHGVLGQKWGIRRYQNKDGTLTNAGKARYSDSEKQAEESKPKIDYRKAAKIGAVSVAAILATYGAYKLYDSGHLDFIKKGKRTASDILTDTSKIEYIKQEIVNTSRIEPQKIQVNKSPVDEPILRRLLRTSDGKTVSEDVPLSLIALGHDSDRETINQYKKFLKDNPGNLNIAKQYFSSFKNESEIPSRYSKETLKELGLI